MKYIAPSVLNTVDATKAIQGGKGGTLQDSNQPHEMNGTAAGYPADE